MTSHPNRVVISGGASGIGLALAQSLANKGTAVAILDLPANLEAALSSLAGSGHSGHAVNVAEAVAVEAAVAEVAAGGTIDGLVISAGIVSQTPLLEISSEEFARVLSVNVLGVHNVVAPVARTMVSNGAAGSIVVLGSIAAFNGGGFMGRGAYSASKAAVLGLVRSYARELAAHGIRANTVAPGATETPMTASLSDEARSRILSGMLNGRFLETVEIVTVIEFLLGAESQAINGQTLHANGGSYFG